MRVEQLITKAVCWIGGHSPSFAMNYSGYRCRICGADCDHRGGDAETPEAAAKRLFGENAKKRPNTVLSGQGPR